EFAIALGGLRPRAACETTKCERQRHQNRRGDGMHRKFLRETCCYSSRNVSSSFSPSLISTFHGLVCGSAYLPLQPSTSCSSSPPLRVLSIRMSSKVIT